MPLNPDGGVTPTPDRTARLAVEKREVKCPCLACKVKRGDWNHGVRNGRLHNWDYTPRNYKFLRTDNDEFPYYLGVELEVTRRSYDEDTTIANSLAIDLRRPKSMWYAKYDSSVSGPEFVSHPATLTYWRKQSAKLQEMFSLLIHAGFRSHNGGAAGMHINVGRCAFEDVEHYHRFLTFLYANRSWATTMSQRTEGQVDQWAPFRPFTLFDSWMVWDRHRGSNKYTMIHTPAYGERVEFRLPRGTLRLDRFYKNLEWTTAMIAYTRNLAVTHYGMSSSAFVSWVNSYPEVYSNLLAFMEEEETSLANSAREDESMFRLSLQQCAYPSPTPIYGPACPNRGRLRYIYTTGTYTSPTTMSCEPYPIWGRNGIEVEGNYGGGTI